MYMEKCALGCGVDVSAAQASPLLITSHCVKGDSQLNVLTLKILLL